MSYEPNDYDYSYEDPSNHNSPKKSGGWGMKMVLALVTTLIVRYPTAAPWTILAVILWLFMFVTNIVNLFVTAAVFQIAWYAMLIAVPFFGLAVPFFLAVIAYEESRSILARHDTHLAAMFKSIDLFISNNKAMIVIEITVVLFAIGGSIGIYQDAGIGTAVMIFAVSVLSPFLCYKSSGLAAASIK